MPAGARAPGAGAARDQDCARQRPEEHRVARALPRQQRHEHRAEPEDLEPEIPDRPAQRREGEDRQRAVVRRQHRPTPQRRREHVPVGLPHRRGALGLHRQDRAHTGAAPPHRVPAPGAGSAHIPAGGGPRRADARPARLQGDPRARAPPAPRTPPTPARAPGNCSSAAAPRRSPTAPHGRRPRPPPAPTPSRHIGGRASAPAPHTPRRTSHSRRSRPAPCRTRNACA